MEMPYGDIYTSWHLGPTFGISMYTEHDWEPLMAVVAMDSWPGYHKVDKYRNHQILGCTQLDFFSGKAFLHITHMEAVLNK